MMDGNLFFLEQHQRMEDEWLDSRPICAVCGEPIQEDVYHTERGAMCEECAEAYAEQLAEEYKLDVMEDWRYVS